MNSGGGAGAQGQLWEGPRLGSEGTGLDALGNGHPGRGETRAPCQGSRALSLFPPPASEAPDASVLLQVTMADRAAAERACKDPNPNIDGRKANVNLAYLGAKPRSLQTGESPVFLPWHFWLLYSALVSVGWKRRPPPPSPLQGWQSAVMCSQRAISEQSSPSLEAEPFPLAVCAGGTGRGGRVTRLSAVLTGGRKLLPGAGGWEDRHPEAAASRVPWPPSAGSFGFTWRWLGRGKEAG